VLLWFVGTSVLAVWSVFRDPRIDYRLVIVGALLPDIVDAPFGGARVGHTLVFSVALLVVVMAATVGRRPARRRLLAIPIGSFLHLVFDGAFTSAHVFWWPFGGLSFDGARLPSVARFPGWDLVLEGLGLAACWWAWNKFGLADPARRRRFLHTGGLDEARR
jgi:hypothetical protein